MPIQTSWSTLEEWSQGCSKRTFPLTFRNVKISRLQESKKEIWCKFCNSLSLFRCRRDRGVSEVTLQHRQWPRVLFCTIRTGLDSLIHCVIWVWCYANYGFKSECLPQIPATQLPALESRRLWNSLDSAGKSIEFVAICPSCGLHSSFYPSTTDAYINVAPYIVYIKISSNLDSIGIFRNCKHW